MKEAKQKIALITGANKGIGFEIARQLATHGMTVLVGARSRERGEAAVEKLRQAALDVRFLPLEVTQEASIAAAVAQVEREFGRLDVLVNNAGIIHQDDRGATATLAAFRATYETNVFAVFRVTKLFLPLLLKSPAARVVNVSSGLGSLTLQAKRAFPLGTALVAYNTSKTALNALTIHLARDLKDTSVKVNAITPGHCATDINGHTGARSAEQGAVAAVQLATIGDDGPTGGLFDKNGSVPW